MSHQKLNNGPTTRPQRFLLPALLVWALPAGGIPAFADAIDDLVAQVSQASIEGHIQALTPPARV